MTKRINTSGEQINGSGLLLALIIFSLCFSHRLSSAFSLIYVLSVLLQGDLWSRFRLLWSRSWVFAFVLLYFIHLLSLTWTADLNSGFFILEKKAALLGIPVFIAMDKKLTKQCLHHVMIALIIGCFVAFWYCIGNAVVRYGTYRDPIVFFYHSFGWPLDHFNAVYFSLYVFSALVFMDYLVFRVNHLFFRWFWWRSLVLLSLFAAILLLSSKLFIVLTVGYWLFVVWRVWQRSGKAPGHVLIMGLGIGVLVVGVLGLGFVKKRFEKLLDADFEVLRLERFEWNTPFNGITIRLVLLKFGWELISESTNVLTGVGVGDAQHEINDLIRKYNLYHGNPNLGDRGYLDYNLHNQFLELWLQVGVAGPILWILILLQAWQLAIRLGTGQALLFIVSAITLYAFIEGVLERQRGVVFIALFFSLFHAIPKDELLSLPNQLVQSPDSPRR